MNKLECGPMPNVTAALPYMREYFASDSSLMLHVLAINFRIKFRIIVGALCSTPQNLADAQYWSAMQ